MDNKYNKENYVHIQEYWKQYMPIVLLTQYKKYFVGKIADFGCNTGLFDLHIASLPGVEEVVGYDINKKAIEQAVKFAKNKNITNVAYHHQNLTTPIDLKEYFDFAVCFHTLEHVFPEDIPAVMENLQTTIKTNGYILVNQPDKHSYAWEKSHVYHPNKEELNDLFTEYGFSSIESYEDERGGQVGHSRNITALYRKN